MERTIQYALHESIMLIEVMAVSTLFWHAPSACWQYVAVLVVTLV